MIEVLGVFFSLALVSIAMVVSTMPEKKKDPTIDKILADVESFSHEFYGILQEKKGYEDRKLTAHDAKGLCRSLESTYRRNGERDKLEKLQEFADFYIIPHMKPEGGLKGIFHHDSSLHETVYNNARDELRIIDAAVAGVRLKNWEQHHAGKPFTPELSKYPYGKEKHEYLDVLGDSEKLQRSKYDEKLAKKRRELKTNPLSDVQPYEVEDLETAVKIAAVKKSLPRELVDGYLRKIEKLAGYLRKTPEEMIKEENEAKSIAAYQRRRADKEEERKSFYRGPSKSKEVKKMVDADSDSIYKRLMKKAKTKRFL